MKNNPSIQIPLTVRLSEIWQRIRGRAPDATYFDRDGIFLGSARELLNPTHKHPSRRAFMASALAAAATSVPSYTTQNNDSALEARRDALDEAIQAIRPLVLRATNAQTSAGSASAVVIDIDKGLLALSAHQGAAGNILVLTPHADHPVQGFVFEARILHTTNAPHANGQDAALAQIFPESRRTFEQYINSVDGLRAPELPAISPDGLRDTQLFVAGYAGGIKTLTVSRATPDFTDAPDAHLQGGLINECAYELRVDNLTISQPGTSGGGVFEVHPDGRVIYHGIITALQGNNPSRPLYLTPISVLNAALEQQGLRPPPRGAYASCTPKPLSELLNYRIPNRPGRVPR